MALRLGLRHAATAAWPALSRARLARMRRKRPVSPAAAAADNSAPPSAAESSAAAQRAALDALLRSALRHPPTAAPAAVRIIGAAASAASAAPTPPLLARVLSAVARHAAASARAAPLTAAGADAAVEALLRLALVTRARPSVHDLCAIVIAAAADPQLERRAPRVWSVWRHLRAHQLQPCARFVFASFRVCADAVDVESAAVLMHFALLNGLYVDHHHSADAPSHLHYYNRFMLAACLSSNYDLVHTALAEMHSCSIPPDAATHNVLLTTALDQRHHSHAQRLVHTMRAENQPWAPHTFAAMIRSAAVQKQPQSIAALHDRYLCHLRSHNLSLAHNISPLAVAHPDSVNQKPTVRACAAARADPTMAAFHAYRSCAAASHALHLLRQLTHAHHMQPSHLLYSLVLDTCYNAGRTRDAEVVRSTIPPHIKP